MKLKIAAILLVSQPFAGAETYQFVVQVPPQTPFSLSLFTSRGNRVGQPITVQYIEDVDVNQDGTTDYERWNASVAGVPPASYAVSWSVDWNGAYTELLAFNQGSPGEIAAGSFYLVAPPTDGSATLTFGGARVSYSESTLSLDSYIGSAGDYDYSDSTWRLPRFTWSVKHPDWDTPQEMMSLGGDGFSLYNGALKLGFGSGLTYFGSPILTESSGDSRYLGISSANSFLTPASADGRYLRTDQSRLRFGTGSNAVSVNSIALGSRVEANGLGAVALGSSNDGIATPWTLQALGKGATAIGFGVASRNDGATAIGWGATAEGKYSVAMGKQTWTDPAAEGAFATGIGSQAIGVASISMGDGNRATGARSISLGWGGLASGNMATTLGALNEASGDVALAVGALNSASGEYSVALGRSNSATNWGAVALGEGNIADGVCSFAFGGQTKANASYSFSGGVLTAASGFNSTALGFRTIAGGASQVVIGTYNLELPDQYPHVHSDSDALLIVGNGFEAEWENPASAVRRNALVVKWNGDTEIAGTVKSAVEGAGKYHKFRAPILVPESGDISMGAFKAGTPP